jgi:hypothetical protein
MELGSLRADAPSTPLAGGRAPNEVAEKPCNVHSALMSSGVHRGTLAHATLLAYEGAVRRDDERRRDGPPKTLAASVIGIHPDA